MDNGYYLIPWVKKKLCSIGVKGLCDVCITDVTNGQILVWDDTNECWANEDPTSVETIFIGETVTGGTNTGVLFVDNGVLSQSNSFIFETASKMFKVVGFLEIDPSGNTYSIGDVGLTTTGTMLKIDATAQTTVVTNSGLSSFFGINIDTPLSNFTVNGNVAAALTTIVPAQSPYNAGAQFTILANTTTGNITINLPVSASNTFRIYNIKNIGTGVNTLTITPNGGETIDGAANLTTSTPYKSYTLQNDGTNWFII